MLIILLVLFVYRAHKTQNFDGAFFKGYPAHSLRPCACAFKYMRRFHSSRAVRRLALGWPSIATRVFAKILAFLAWVLENSDSIGHHFYDCLLESSDEGSMQLLDGCSFLEELLGVEGCLQRIKEGSSSSREIKKELIDLDFSSLLEESKTHSSTSVAAEIAESTSWLKIWDLALDYGPRSTSAIQALFSTMTRTMCGSAPCGFCEDSVTTTYLDHFLLCHLPTNCPGMSKEDIIGELKKANPDINYIIRLYSLLIICPPLDQSSNVFLTSTLTLLLFLFLFTSECPRAYMN